MTTWLQPTTLSGRIVTLIPLDLSHREELLQAAADGKLWEMWYTSVPSADTIDTYLHIALEQRDQGTALPFVVVHKATNTIIGSTRYCNAERVNRRLEIGYTWYAKSFQRTGVNTECKYLLLQHAFDHLQTIAVEFRTHWHNFQSRTAILRLGAKQDGVLRNHLIDREGCMRDTVVFSIIQSEWNTVRRSLEYRME